MELKDLKPAEGSRKNRKRVGRGHAAGQGKTAGRGMNGQKSRSGGGKGAGFEGGQTPLARRLPKLPGFRNINRVEYLPVNVSRLEEKFEAGDVVDGASLKAKGIIKHEDALVKVLGDGDITKALTIKVDKVSASAKAKIEAAGGKVEEPCLALSSTRSRFPSCARRSCSRWASLRFIDSVPTCRFRVSRSTSSLTRSRIRACP